MWCPGAESNHRHADFQSAALPTELPGRSSRGEAPSGNERRCIGEGAVDVYIDDPKFAFHRIAKAFGGGRRAKTPFTLQRVGICALGRPQP